MIYAALFQELIVGVIYARALDRYCALIHELTIINIV